MRGEQDLKDAIKQNLIDSGCKKKQIESFFELYEQARRGSASGSGASAGRSP